MERENTMQQSRVMQIIHAMCCDVDHDDPVRLIKETIGRCLREGVLVEPKEGRKQLVWVDEEERGYEKGVHDTVVYQLNQNKNKVDKKGGKENDGQANK